MPDIRHATVVVCIIFPILATIAVICRFVARKARKMQWLADDWIILIALLATIAMCILTAYGVIAKGLGYGPLQLLPQNVKEAFKLFYVIQLLAYFTQGATKISILLFYRRLFASPRFKLATNIMIGLIICWAISTIIIEALNSWNIVGFWNDKLLNYPAWNESAASLDFVFDVAVILYPLPVIKTLQINRRQKISLFGIFGLGSIAIIASAIRIYYCWAQLHFEIGVTSEARISYVNTAYSLWIAVEACIAIIAACLPTLSAFLKGRSWGKPSKNSKYLYVNSSRKPIRDGNSLDPKNSGRQDWISLDNMSPTQQSLNATTNSDVLVEEDVKHPFTSSEETTFNNEMTAS